jgi:ABC-2 type transport system ATP-binding protein
VDGVAALLEARADVRGVRPGERNGGGSLKIDYTGDPDEVHQLLRDLLVAGFKVQSFSEQETDLEDIFMKVTRGAVQ